MDRIEGLRNASILAFYDKKQTCSGPAQLQSFIKNLPLMTGTSCIGCSFSCFSHLATLLSKFREVYHLILQGVFEMNDVQLQRVAQAKLIASLWLVLAISVSPMGLLNLCRSMHGLGCVSILHCGIVQRELDHCRKLLDRNVKLVAEIGQSN